MKNVNMKKSIFRQNLPLVAVNSSWTCLEFLSSFLSDLECQSVVLFGEDDDAELSASTMSKKVEAVLDGD